MSRVALLLLLLPLISACGGDQEPDPLPPRGPCSLTEIDVRAARVPLPVPGLYWGQEIWITYKSDKHRDYGVRSSRSRPEALDLARRLCRAVRAGEDIGRLARKWSNGMGGIAMGFAVVPRPEHRSAPDARDVALMQASPGELTPLIEWQGGFWFARRVSETAGKALGDQLQVEMRKRATARVIHIHHKGASPRRHQFDDYKKEQAVAKAWALLKQIQAGADFEELARLHNNDRESRARGGLLMTRDPRTGKPTEWIRWGDRNFNQPLLEVLLEKGVPGVVWPEPIISGQGVDIALLIKRDQGGLEAPKGKPN